MRNWMENEHFQFISLSNGSLIVAGWIVPVSASSGNKIPLFKVYKMAAKNIEVERMKNAKIQQFVLSIIIL